MIWSAIEKCIRPMVLSRRAETWYIQRSRRKLPTNRVDVSNLQRRLFVDVSVISKHDACTGIQRVVRAVASHLIANPPDGWEVCTVSASRIQPYQPISWPSGGVLDDYGPIVARPGDVFLGLDFALDPVRFHKKQLTVFKQNGGHLWFIMYDLLPVQKPDWFSDKLVVRYRKWLSILAALADGFYCISPPVEADLCTVLEQRYGLMNSIPTYVIPMGCDIATSQSSKGLPDKFDGVLNSMSRCPTALMVGTLEPRKGHADVLAAFEALWQQGSSTALVIVGRPGWKTENLQITLRTHPENGKHLFWFDDASDEALSLLYNGCSGVIVASYAEGFGLPIIEALGYGKPVLARNIPVFRLHEEKGVSYFSHDIEPTALADTIQTWLANGVNSPPQSQYVTSWADTTQAILDALMQGAK